MHSPADSRLFAWLRDGLLAFFNHMEENNDKKAESGKKFIKNQSKNPSWRKLYNIIVVS